MLLDCAQSAYTGLKCYVAHAKDASWEYHGQEWYVLDVFLTCAVHTARLHVHTSAPREARWYLKEALNAAQQHVLVLRSVFAPFQNPEQRLTQKKNRPFPMASAGSVAYLNYFDL